MNDRPAFYQLLTDPFSRLRSQEMVDAECARFGNVPGPHPTPHLTALGYGLTSLGSGFHREWPPASVIYKNNPRRPLRDFESFGGSLWIVSPNAKVVLQEWAARQIDFMPADVRLRDKSGDASAGERWVLDVIRFEDAVDEAASHIAWAAGKQYGIGSKYVFKRETPRDLHLFRLTKGPDIVACSAELRAAARAAKLTGVAFDKF